MDGQHETRAKRGVGQTAGLPVLTGLRARMAEWLGAAPQRCIKVTSELAYRQGGHGTSLPRPGVPYQENPRSWRTASRCARFGPTAPWPDPPEAIDRRGGRRRKPAPGATFRTCKRCLSGKWSPHPLMAPARALDWLPPRTAWSSTPGLSKRGPTPFAAPPSPCPCWR